VASDVALLVDVLYLYAARTIPKGSPFLLPDVRKNWGFFGNSKTMALLSVQRFEKFTQAVASAGDRDNVFFFFHSSLPHSPYIFRPNGQLEDVTPNSFEDTLKENPYLLAKVVERYRRQIMFTDSLLGRFLDLLRRRGLYERSLLVVTADHGVSYNPEALGRDLREVDGVVPFQEQGVVSNREVQLVDMMPTVADVLDVEVPWHHVGRSVFSTSEEARSKIAYNRHGKKYELPSDLSQVQARIALDATRQEQSSGQ
jgi:phosphoglycerol transferase MdoB-like AlkP superfamily enzyme